jgi:transposase
LKAELKANIYPSSASICAFILAKFGVSYTSHGLVPLLHQLGFSYKKTKLVPCEADKAKQEKFVEDLNSLLAGLEAEEAIYFADAVHPQHNTKSSYAWIEKGQEKEILSVSGRQRLNLNAVINAQNPSEVIMVEGKTINADNTWELYQKIEALHPEKKQIFIICDNARYYKNKALNEKLAHSKIKQIFLPPYSPNLNLIERLWKLMRKKVINHQFYRKFEEFKAGIFHFFEHIADYKDEIETLISWNFHIPKSKTNFY